MAKFTAAGQTFTLPEVYGMTSVPKPLLGKSFITFLHDEYGIDNFGNTFYAQGRESFPLGALLQVDGNELKSYMGVKRFNLSPWSYPWNILKLEAVPCNIELHPCRVGVRELPDKPWLKEAHAAGQVPAIKVRDDFPYYLLTDQWVRRSGSMIHLSSEGDSLPENHECWYIVRNPFWAKPDVD